MSEISQNTFVCCCGHEDDLEKNLLEISDHMKECNEFEDKSPLSSILKKIYLERLSYKKLLVLYADIYAWMMKVDQMIESKKIQINLQDFPLKGYNDFVKEETEYKLNKKVKIQESVLNVCKQQQVSSDEEDLQDNQDDQHEVIPEIVPDDSQNEDNVQNVLAKSNNGECSQCHLKTGSSHDKYAFQEGKPSMLSCGHTICKDCLILNYKEPSSKYLACPIDDCKTPIPFQRLYEAAFGKQNTCLLCSKTVTTKSNLDRHVNLLHSQGKRFGCPYCSLSFNTYRLVQYHIQSKHTEGAKKTPQVEEKK